MSESGFLGYPAQPPYPEGADIQQKAIADLVQRRQVGMDRYGRLLTPWNGRNPIREAYEECQDMLVYLRQAIDENATPQQKVIQFHKAMGLPVVERPTPPPANRMALRLSLMREEFNEVVDACIGPLEDLAKELADLVYVTYGMAIEAGIDLDAVLDEVHKSNMSKAGPDGKVTYREDGKVLKPPHYRAPDIKRVLEETHFFGGLRRGE